MFLFTPRTCQLLSLALLTAALAAGCKDEESNQAVASERACQVPTGTQVDYLQRVECTADFMAIASQPIDADLPGSNSVKIVLDQENGDTLWFQNSQKYNIHYEFVKAHVKDPGLLTDFNANYTQQPDRRFLLAAVTLYTAPDPDVWALEFAPYDTATAAQITKLYQAVQNATWFGPLLWFHPTSGNMTAEVKKLAASVKVKTTEDLYGGTPYQPLSLGSSIGRLHFTLAQNLATEYIPYDNIVVLDEAPNDISVVRGIITEQFQTPLSHVNVLSRNRKTPNMGLRKAMSDPTLLALDDKLVELTVAADKWTIREATQAEADAYEAAHPRPKVTLPALDLSVTELTNIQDVTPETPGGSLRDDIVTGVTRFGGKAANFSILTKTDLLDTPAPGGIKDDMHETDGWQWRSPTAFAIPVYFYDQFMKENNFYERVAGLLADENFKSDSNVRKQQLQKMRDDMAIAPVDPAFEEELMTKLNAEFPGVAMRFRSSTNSEDLDGFPCAGCYESHTGDPAIPGEVLTAVRKVWASVWLYRTFELRQYYSVDHNTVGMGILVHHSFPDEEANGVAVSNNPFDPSGLEPAFYINVQWGGDAEVVAPPPGVFSDQILYFFEYQNQPARYLSHSNLIPDDGNDDTNVLTRKQLYSLGISLKALHARFAPAYNVDTSQWYGMDIEFKFDNASDPSAAPALVVKQARPYPSITATSGN